MFGLIFRRLVVQCCEELLCELEVAHVGGGLSLCGETIQGMCEGEGRQIDMGLMSSGVVCTTVKCYQLELRLLVVDVCEVR